MSYLWHCRRRDSSPFGTRRRRRFDEKGKLLLDLGDTVGKMKRDFGVERVLAWHAMTGYWAGVEPEASEMVPFDPLVAKLLAPEGVRKVDPQVSRTFERRTSTTIFGVASGVCRKLWTKLSNACLLLAACFERPTPSVLHRERASE